MSLGTGGAIKYTLSYAFGYMIGSTGARKELRHQILPIIERNMRSTLHPIIGSLIASQPSDLRLVISDLPYFPINLFGF
jgi:hypothetical protein